MGSNRSFCAGASRCGLVRLNGVFGKPRFDPNLYIQAQLALHVISETGADLGVVVESCMHASLLELSALFLKFRNCAKLSMVIDRLKQFDGDHYI